MTTRTDKLAHNLELYRARWQLAHDADPTIPLMHPDLFALALDDTVSKRAPYNFLRTPPTYRERPIGSLFLRLKRWHAGNGQLDSRMIATWDARNFIRNVTGPARNLDLSRYPDDLARLLPSGDRAAERLVDMIDNTLRLMRGGPSSATRAWERALGVVPS